MFLREGRLIEARQQLDQAVASLADAPEIDQCKIMLNRGEVNGLIGDVAAAKADSARALELAQAYGLPTLAFYGTHNLGLFEFLSGNLPRALELMPSIEQASSDFERGVVGLDRARVLLSAGLVSEADRSLVEACTALSRTELVQFLAEAELIRAEVALLADNPELAQTVSSAAVARLRPRNNHRATALGELVKLRADAAAHTPGHQLVGVADRLTGVFSDLGLPDQARLARLIAIDYSMANAPALPRRLPTISPAQPLELRLYGRLVRTRLAFARGDRVSGLRQARTGMLELAKYQAQFGSLDLQTSSAVRGSQPGRRRDHRGDRGRPPDLGAHLAGAGPGHLQSGDAAAAPGGRVSPPTCSPSSAGRPASWSARSSPGVTARCSAGAGRPWSGRSGPGPGRSRARARSTANRASWTCGGRSAKRRWWRSSCCMRRSTASCSPSTAAGCVGCAAWPRSRNWPAGSGPTSMRSPWTAFPSRSGRPSGRRCAGAPVDSTTCCSPRSSSRTPGSCCCRPAGWPR